MFQHSCLCMMADNVAGTCEITQVPHGFGVVRTERHLRHAQRPLGLRAGGLPASEGGVMREVKSDSIKSTHPINGRVDGSGNGAACA